MPAHQHSAGSEVDVFVDRDSERSEAGQVQRVLAAWRSFVFAFVDEEGQPHEEAPPPSSSPASSSDSNE